NHPRRLGIETTRDLFCGRLAFEKRLPEVTPGDLQTTEDRRHIEPLPPSEFFALDNHLIASPNRSTHAQIRIELMRCPHVALGNLGLVPGHSLSSLPTAPAPSSGYSPERAARTAASPSSSIGRIGNAATSSVPK